MTPERWSQIRQIFDGALERVPKDRAAYLRVACAQDDELRREVESLLESHQDSTEFLAEPAARISESLFREEEPADYPDTYKIGPYQFERRIGRGGMGSVWLASQPGSEYAKKVAVKMVRRGMDSHEILRRFRMERQVLAGLDHPNIARLIDGGSTPEGLPYLVMEYVEGIPIDQYCENRKATITERLRLFRDVCSAVQYAHQNLVVHRDIKTGNILVRTDGVPKLLDFGIAKLLRADLSTLGLAQTRPEVRPMTLDYASPEQVRGEPITTATDVYSLGVLLYKMLTSAMPYGLETRSQAAIQKAICETEPRKPSSVVLADTKTSIPEATQKMEAVDETRTKARKRLRRKLAGDLDMIILKALRKEPKRRYASVEQFSEDIRRYLEGRPVLARSDTPGYRLGKFLRRNAIPVAAAALIGITLALSATVLYRRNQTVERERAQTQRTLDATRQELVTAYLRMGEPDKALPIAQTLLAARPGDPEEQRAVALASMSLGDLLARRGEPSGAAQRYAEALAQFDTIAQPRSSDFDAQRDVMSAADKLGSVQFEMGNLLASLSSFSHALQSAEAVYSGESTRGREPAVSTRLAAAACNAHVGEVLLRNGATEAGSAKLRKALDLIQSLPNETAGGLRKEIEDKLSAMESPTPITQ